MSYARNRDLADTNVTGEAVISDAKGIDGQAPRP
jgi:hypothetical protein